MKKFLSFLSIFPLVSLTAFAGTFPDVEDTHDHFDAIEFLYEEEIIHGYEDGQFRPDQLVTRAEATKMIVGGLGVAIDGEYEVVFPDVAEDAWYFDYVMGGNHAGIIDGYADGTFKPSDNVNMAETLKILLEAAAVDLPSPDSQVFVDVGADIWFSSHALYARDNNIVIADEDGELKGDRDVTRSEFAEVVYRLMVVRETGQPFPIHTDWPVYESPNMPFGMKYDESSWDIVEHHDETVFYALDSKNGQSFYQVTYPNSAKVTVSVMDDGGEIKSAYFDGIKAAFPGASYKLFSHDGVDGIEIVQSDKLMVDWYFYMEDGTVLGVFTEYGDGPLSFKWPRYIQAMLSTFSFAEPTGLVSGVASDDQILSDILQNVLIENVGLTMIEKTGDAIIIETDTIGVGTGPVDYYYSAKFDHTFKYERNSDLILDTREGETTAF